jgi:sulfide:quinone oxidoreductase
MQSTVARQSDSVDTGHTHQRVLIVGGGTAGISVAARLRRAGIDGIAVVEPSEKHYYQPLWTLVGGGIMDKSESERTEASVMPAGVRWIKDRVAAFSPDENLVELESGTKIGYDYLVVAAGLQCDWARVTGLEAALREPNVSSNYDFHLAPKTWEMIRTFRGGTAMFQMRRCSPEDHVFGGRLFSPPRRLRENRVCQRRAVDFRC